MHELVNKSIQWTLNLTGIRGKEYTTEITKLNKERRSLLYITIHDKDMLVSVKGPFSSPFDMGLDIGRKRILGRLEWITGIGCEMTGFVFMGSNLSCNISNTEGLQLLASIGLYGLGYVLAEDGKKRKDIASSIINKFSKK